MGLDNVCRLCRLTTSKNNELSSLFENNLAKKLKLCYSIIVEFDENLPTKVCPICRTTIEQAAYFKKRCEDTNAYFDEYLKKKGLASVCKQLANQLRTNSKLLSISGPSITSRHGSPKTLKALPNQDRVLQDDVKQMTAIPLPCSEAPKQPERDEIKEEDHESSVVRQVAKQYTRKQKNDPRPSTSTGPTRESVVLFESCYTPQSSVKIKEEPRSVAEILGNDWSDDSLSPGSAVSHSPKNGEITVKTPRKINLELDDHRNEDEWEDDGTLLTIKTEPFHDSFETPRRTPKKRIIGEEVLVENHCNLLAVYNGDKTPTYSNKRSNKDNIITKTPAKKKIRFHCTECPSGFTDEIYLTTHTCGNLRYACYICKGIFKNQYALMKHMSEHQSKNQRTFGNQQDFKEEMDENLYSSGNYIRMESTHKRQKTMYFKDN